MDPAHRMNPHFALLSQAYHHRLDGLDAVRQTGQVLVGCVGNTVPTELITACGARAWRIAPADGAPEQSDTHVEAFADRDARLIFALYVGGALDALDLLVLPRSSETWHKLYLALREAQRTGLKTDGPPLHLHDLLHTQRESSRRYGLARTVELAERVSALVAARGGQPDWAACLGAAVAQTNTTRGLLQRLQDLRRQGRCSGWQAQVATGALQFMAPAAGQAALAAWLQALEDAGTGQATSGAPAEAAARAWPRLYVQGVALDHAELHRLVDDLGACIVQEDDDWGSRAATPLIDSRLPALEAVFNHYWREVPCGRIHPEPPGPPAWLRAWQDGAIDGLLFHLPRPDDVQGWRFPAQRDAASQAGLPWLLLRDDARDAPTLPELRRGLAQFIDRLRTA